MDHADYDNTRSLQLSIDRQLLHYRVISFVGSGGMGEVYLAQDEKPDRLVALKTLLPQWAASGQHRKKFVNEARASARLNHKSICSVFAIEEDDDRVFISMEYVQGSTLRDIINDESEHFDLLPSLELK